ncbi:sigma-70 family RNA polymerase sigma factor [Paenibacillus sp. FSL H3-0333]|uniref:sigma-70 family RNA polymerase sigma factor n=1 Tax=Paenibacillus sp. FSL H3-0333 TaxID=2921373 RepID=UPI0030F8B5E0
MKLEHIKFNSSLNNESSIKKAKKIGNKDLRDRIINNNIPLVIMLVNRWRSLGSIVDPEDLRSMGLIGLLKAYEAFDLGKKIKFSSFAGKVIWREFMANARYDQMKCRSKYIAVSMDSSVYISKKEKKELKIRDIICDDIPTEEYSLIENMIFSENLEQLIDYALKGNEQTVAKKHLLEGKGFTEISSEMNISRQGVHQIHKRYLPQLALAIN